MGNIAMKSFEDSWRRLRLHATGAGFMELAHQNGNSPATRGLHAWGFALCCSALPEPLWYHGLWFSGDAQVREHRFASADRAFRQRCYLA